MQQGIARLMYLKNADELEKSGDLAKNVKKGLLSPKTDRRDRKRDVSPAEKALSYAKMLHKKRKSLYEK